MGCGVTVVFFNKSLAPTRNPKVEDQMCRSCFAVMMIILVWNL